LQAERESLLAKFIKVKMERFDELSVLGIKLYLG
jgi:hypothetical protein